MEEYERQRLERFSRLEVLFAEFSREMRENLGVIRDRITVIETRLTRIEQTRDRVYGGWKVLSTISLIFGIIVGWLISLFKPH